MKDAQKRITGKHQIPERWLASGGYSIKQELTVRGVFCDSIATESGQLLNEAPACEAIFTHKMACLRGDNRVSER